MASLLAAYPVATQEAWRTTVNLARVQTQNQARNQVPAYAQAWLDIRFPAQDSDLAGPRTAERSPPTWPASASRASRRWWTASTRRIMPTPPPPYPDVLRLQRAARSQG